MARKLWVVERLSKGAAEWRPVADCVRFRRSSARNEARRLRTHWGPAGERFRVIPYEPARGGKGSTRT